MRRDPRNSHHLATISHGGRFWDAYLELEDTQDRAEPVRGRIAFSAAGEEVPDPIRTTTIFLEDTAPEVLARAREFKTHQLVALLRSCAPEEAEGGPGAVAPEP
jgi:hypothetical protein